MSHERCAELRTGNSWVILTILNPLAPETAISPPVPHHSKQRKTNNCVKPYTTVNYNSLRVHKNVY